MSHDVETTDSPIDEATATSLREAGLPVSKEMSESEAFRAYMLPAQAMLRKQALANEKGIKTNFVDWVFKKLNLTKYR